MIALCIAYPPIIECSHIHDIFFQAGMQSVTVNEGTISTIEAWQEKVAALQPSLNHPLQIGAFLKDSISGLYEKMLDQPCWGWPLKGDWRFLEYWKSFDSSIRFILFTAPPVYFLSALIDKDSSTFQSKTIEQWVELWRDYHQNVLDFHLQHKDISALLCMERFADAPDKSMLQLFQRWNLALSQPDPLQGGTWQPSSLIRNLVKQSLSCCMEIEDLAKSVADCLQSSSPSKSAAHHADDLSSCIDDYLSLCYAGNANLECRTRLRDLAAEHALLKKQSAQLQDESELILKELHQVQEELEQRLLKGRSLETSLAQNAEICTALKNDNRVLSTELETIQVALKTIEEEHTLLSRKYASQEEHLQECTNQNTALRDKFAVVTAENESQQRDIASLRSRCASEKDRCDSLAKELLSLQNKHKNLIDESKLLQSENNSFLSQLHQAQEELALHIITAQKYESVLAQELTARASLEKEKRNLSAKLESLQKELKSFERDRVEREKSCQLRINEIEIERDDLSLEVTKLRSEHDILAEEIRNTLAANKELTVQNDGMREQLDTIAHANKKLRHQLGLFLPRYQELLKKNVDYVAYEDLKVSVIPHEEHVQWHFTHIDIAGRSFPLLEFKTFLESGIGGFLISRSSGMLKRWPAIASEEDTLVILPAGDDGALQSRLDTFHALASSDYALITLLSKHLASLKTVSGEIHKTVDEKQQATIKKGFSEFIEKVSLLPPCIRYERVTLVREQRNPDYEHLWFRIENARFAEHQAKAFEWRISSSIDTGEGFGKHPKLEFPQETGASLFEKWYAESQDDFSPKWELRFALPCEMDKNAWFSIAEHDRALIFSIAKQLPGIFSEIAAQGFTPTRGWNDWINLSKHVIQILHVQTAGIPDAAV